MQIRSSIKLRYDNYNTLSLKTIFCQIDANRQSLAIYYVIVDAVVVYLIQSNMSVYNVTCRRV